jgi:hypothetical protein
MAEATWTLKAEPLGLRVEQCYGGDRFVHEIWWEAELDQFVASGDDVAIPPEAMVAFARALLEACGNEHDQGGVDQGPPTSRDE